MQLRLLSLFTLLVILFSACHKQDVSATNSQDASENCFVQTRSTGNGDVIEGQYIIAYKNNPDASRAGLRTEAELSTAVLASHNISTSALQQTYGGREGGFIAHLSAAQAHELSADPTVAAVEPDRIIALGSCFTIVAPSLITWNVNQVGYGNGIGKTAWIIDTGVDYTHPDLNVDSVHSRSFLPGVASANDENGHGTHVAGIIGAKNNNFGVLGVASGATLISLRVLDQDGNGTLSSVIQALAYVASNGHAGDVVNMSVGEEEVSDILDQQVQAVAAKGIYVTIAAGNDGKAADLYSPGRANGSNIYTVSAVDSLGNFASFSNYGNDVVDYAEPGVRILSTYKHGQYARMSGTSMAAPHLAGLLLINGGVVHSSATAKNDPDGTPDPIGVK